MTPTKETLVANRRATQQITTDTDSREILANAKRDIERYKLNDYFIVDVDAHHVEFDSWDEVLDQIEDPVLRRNGKVMAESLAQCAPGRVEQPYPWPHFSGCPRPHPSSSQDYASASTLATAAIAT